MSVTKVQLTIFTGQKVKRSKVSVTVRQKWSKGTVLWDFKDQKQPFGRRHACRRVCRRGASLSINATIEKNALNRHTIPMSTIYKLQLTVIAYFQQARAQPSRNSQSLNKLGRRRRRYRRQSLTTYSM